MYITNKEILEKGKELKNILENNDRYIPAKICFIIQKNISKILNVISNIENTRILIGKKYGELDEENNRYIIPKENIEEANKELESLLSIGEDYPIELIKLSDIENINFTLSEINTLSFMIKEE